MSRLQVAVDRVAALAAEHREPPAAARIAEFMALSEDCTASGGHRWVVTAGGEPDDDPPPSWVPSFWLVPQESA